MYSEGLGVEQDFNKAIELFEKAAEQGNTVALRELGEIYQNGETGVVDEAKAFSYFSRASVLGDPAAHITLGLMYAEGTGVPRNAQRAISLMQLAADKDFTIAYLTLGTLTHTSIPQHYSHSLPPPHPPPHKIASLYLAGVGVEMDRKKGMEYARIGAKKGDPLCQAQLAMLLLTSGDESGVLDFRGAAEWYHAAALQGSSFGEVFRCIQL